MGYLYIFITVILTAYGQLILKWRLDQLQNVPVNYLDKTIFFLKCLLDPYILSSFVAAFLASLTWMATLKEFELSKAYPFMNLSLVLVILISFLLFKETITTPKILGCVLIIAGVVLASKG